MYQVTCEVCKKTFTTKRHRRCCNRQCSSKLMMFAKGLNPWQEKELVLLEKMVGCNPIVDIVEAIQQLDRRQRWPLRTETAIRVKLKRMGHTLKCVLDNLTPADLAKSLGINRDRVDAWVEKYGLPYRKVDNYKGAIRLSDFQNWAREHPQKLAGIDQDCLEWLLQDAEFSAYCSNLPVPVQGRPQPVKDLTTGNVFPSFKAAARANYLEEHGIQAAIHRGGTAASKRWQPLNEWFVPKDQIAARIHERQQRLEVCNSLLQTISSCGRRFFHYDGRVARLEIDNRRHHLWFVDESTQKRIYLHSNRSHWKGFTGSSTLQTLIKALKVFIMEGQPLRQVLVLGPFPDWIHQGDPWGYGNDMTIVRQKAIDLGIYEEPPRNFVRRQQRLEVCNSLLQTIASCGRKFFHYDGRIGRLEMDDRRHHLWFVDEYTQKHIYLHSSWSQWKGFTGGGTLKDLIKALKVFVVEGKQIRQALGPFPSWICEGDPWGYGDDMAIVRQTAIDLGIYEAVAAVEKTLAEVC